MWHFRTKVAVAVLAFAIASTNVGWCQSAGVTDGLLSLDQQTKISQIIAKQSVPLTAGGFAIAVGRVVPNEVDVRALPAEAQAVAPQLRDYGYVVVEEQIALVSRRSRKVEIVFPRWGS